MPHSFQIDPKMEMFGYQQTQQQTAFQPQMPMQQTTWHQEGPWPRTDIGETTTNYLLHIELPGLTADDISLDARPGMLVIRGERPALEEELHIHANIDRMERRHGRFQRAFTLPPAVDVDRMKAVMENGVCCVRIPKTNPTTTSQTIPVLRG